ncbi:MAG TPA: thiazole biosynthesis adenylyltransferase ThiF [Clostridiaceae bacterium]|nr:thiazole biosynthesis adenylyltransferase ThiF [Clostridiaceae bacterium]
MKNMERYKRQMTFEQLGEAGQEKLLNSRVCIIGVGALGSIIANDLCRAGVGFIRFIDRDFVEKINLQRQILFTEKDAAEGLPKAEAAHQKLLQANSEIELESIISDVNSSNIEDYIKDADLVIDGTDNFETRFLINEACHKHCISWIYGGVIAGGGATMNFLNDGGPCFRCFLPDMPDPGSYPTCSTVGVINPITGIIASYEVAEAMKILTGSPQVRRTYMAIDVWENTVDFIEIEKISDCPVCAQKKYELLNRPASSYSTSLCGHDSWQIIPDGDVKADFETLASALERHGDVKVSKFSLRFHSENVSFKIFPDGRAIIDRVKNGREAKEIYNDYIGL